MIGRAIRWTLLAALVVAVVDLLFVGYIAGVFAPALAWLVFGWIGFLARVGPRIEWGAGGWALALGAFVAVTAIGHAMFAKPGWSVRRSLALATLATVGCVAGIAFVGAVHETSWIARSEEAFEVQMNWGRSRSPSANSLKALGVGLHNYLAAEKSFPSQSATGELGQVPASWQDAIVPYMEIDAELANAPIAAPAPFRNRSIPGDQRGPSHVAHFAGNVRVLGRREPLKETDVVDGLSNTIAIGEIESGFLPWRDPRNLRDPGLGIRPGPNTFCGHPKRIRGASFLMLDGAVRHLPARTDVNVMQALATPDGGEPKTVYEALPR